MADGILKNIEVPQNPVIAQVIRDLGNGSFRVKYNGQSKTMRSAAGDSVKVGATVMVSQSDGKRPYITNVIGLVGRLPQKVVVI